MPIETLSAARDIGRLPETAGVLARHGVGDAVGRPGPVATGRTVADPLDLARRASASPRGRPMRLVGGTVAGARDGAQLGPARALRASACEP
jgi:hypothetical protein